MTLSDLEVSVLAWRMQDKGAVPHARGLLLFTVQDGVGVLHGDCLSKTILRRDRHEIAFDSLR
jgi:hypothetical protein